MRGDGDAGMTLAEMVKCELDKLPRDEAHRAVIFLGEEICKRYEANLETLGNIAELYVQTSREFHAGDEALRRREI
jgi:hypothetical protein